MQSYLNVNLWKYDPEMYVIVPHQSKEIQCHTHYDTLSKLYRADVYCRACIANDSNRKFESSMITFLLELVNNQLNFTFSFNEQKFLQFICTTEKRLLRGLLYFEHLIKK